LNHIFNNFLLVYADENLAVMSAGFMLSADAALIWGGARKNGLVKNFLKEVEWGELNYLFIDSPPGTSDEHLSITSLTPFLIKSEILYKIWVLHVFFLKARPPIFKFLNFKMI